MLKIHHAIHLPNPTDISKLAFLLVAHPSSQMPSLAALTFSLSPFCPAAIQLLSLISLFSYPITMVMILFLSWTLESLGPAIPLLGFYPPNLKILSIKIYES